MRLCLLLLLMVPALWAQDLEGDRPRARLQLSPEVRARVQAIHQEYVVKRKDVESRLQSKRATLAQLLESGAAQPQTEAILNEILALEGERQRSILQEYYAVVKHLDEPQKQVFTRIFMRALSSGDRPRRR